MGRYYDDYSYSAPHRTYSEDEIVGISIGLFIVCIVVPQQAQMQWAQMNQMGGAPRYYPPQAAPITPV
ncbi:hypothetical protein PRIPAC_87944 [Pristionchus pacificus]|uniref:Uncharacterized protein n=1 Tax=Pristionchus pacificus TaxID=54126 RepID=A0A2A6B7R6_PRIPA|nr:hypothetical protein PRIPAC_87944 [Pristionchus pacificus]|eukprot:PDM61918.1 hypothetical protein PRIPAC_51360 [Pristionchus pacificus]